MLQAGNDLNLRSVISLAMACDIAGVLPLSFSQVTTKAGCVIAGSGLINSRTPCARIARQAA